MKDKEYEECTYCHKELGDSYYAVEDGDDFAFCSHACACEHLVACSNIKIECVSNILREEEV